MSVYTAGLLNVTTLNATGASAVLEANTATVTNLNADVVTTQDLTLTNLTIPTDGTFDVEGLNIYEGTYTAGDLISYTLKGTMSTATASAYFGAVYTGDNAIYLPDSSYNINFYEMVYWGIDSRSNDTTRMSATVCIPATVVSPTIVSYKHGTLGNTYQYYTLWQEMKNISDGSGSVNKPELDGWYYSTTGYVTVCADNPGYGVSVGNYNFLDPTGESQSQYNAIVALKQLIEKRPALFNGTSFVAPIDVISTGYALGALFCPLVSELVALNPSLNLVNTIAGGPVNAYALINAAIYGGTDGVTPSSNPTSLGVLYLFLLLFATDYQLYGTLFNVKPEVTYCVIPLFQQLYLDTARNNRVNNLGGLFTPIIRFIQKATNNQAILNSSFQPYTQLYPAGGFVAYFIPSTIFNGSTNNLLIGKQFSFFTNIFEDFTELSGTPINVIYSQQDELSCYTAANPYIGTLATDQISGPLNIFLTTDNSGNGGFNGLNRAPYSDTDIDASQNLLSGPSGLMQTAATALVDSEGTNNCSNTRWNTLPLGANLQTHGIFGPRIYQTVIRDYLKSRLD